MCHKIVIQKRDHRFSKEGRTLEADKLALHTLNLRAALVVVVRELLICTGTYLEDEEIAQQQFIFVYIGGV